MEKQNTPQKEDTEKRTGKAEMKKKTEDKPVNRGSPLWRTLTGHNVKPAKKR